MLKKSYTNRTRLTKVEKIKLLAEKKKHSVNNQKQLKQMEVERMSKLKAEIEENVNSSTVDEKKEKVNNENEGGPFGTPMRKLVELL